MKVGLQIVKFNWQPAQIAGKLAAVARAADDAGFASIWVMDHFFQLAGLGKAQDNMLECYTTLGYLAGITQRVRLGALVTGVIYREPALLMKAVTQLDVLSGGRAYLGLGAAWFEREAQGLGFAFPPIKERFERLEEALQIIKTGWDGGGSYQGKHYHLPEIINNPPPVSQPHPPIMIGGGGEKKTLRLVAQYADACNLFMGSGGSSLATVKHKLAVLKAHCDDLGRDYNSIERTTLGTADLSKNTAAELIAHCHELASIGVQHAIFNLPDYDDLGVIETFKREIIPAVAGL